MTDLLDERRGHSLAEIRASLAETIEWCYFPGLYDSDDYRPLRTTSFKPAALPIPRNERKRGIEMVIQARRGALRDHVSQWEETRQAAKKFGLREPGPRIRTESGRLLVYSPDDEYADGAPQHETFGYFDVHDAPPWDTWVANLVEPDGYSMVLCWVPQRFVGLAQAGIEVDFAGSIMWLDAYQPAIAQLLAD